MKTFIGIDLGSTTTKAVLLDDQARVLGRGITNSRSNYELAANIAREDALISARFELIRRALESGGDEEKTVSALLRRFRQSQHLAQLAALRERALGESKNERLLQGAPGLEAALQQVFEAMERAAKNPLASTKTSEFFRDLASSRFSAAADSASSPQASFDSLMTVFDKSIVDVEATAIDLSFGTHIVQALDSLPSAKEGSGALREAVERAVEADLEPALAIGTGYGRQTLPFEKKQVRSEILCHGLGAHAMFPRTATVLDIGGQDTKAIQVDDQGIVTSFQMNDRCAAGCGRYLGYIADEMNMGVHELGPLALESTRRVKITSTCTVFAGAELRERLSLGEKREDILAGLHRAIVLRAMALLARSGGVSNEMTFTGGVANNPAAVNAVKRLIEENYGDVTINVSPSSIYTGALGAGLFAQREVMQA